MSSVRPHVRKLFPDMAALVDSGKCPFCKLRVTEDDFGDDDVARKKFGISGLCLKRQDEMFGNRE